MSHASEILEKTQALHAGQNFGSTNNIPETSSKINVDHSGLQPSTVLEIPQHSNSTALAKDLEAQTGEIINSPYAHPADAISSGLSTHLPLTIREKAFAQTSQPQTGNVPAATRNPNGRVANELTTPDRQRAEVSSPLRQFACKKEEEDENDGGGEEEDGDGDGEEHEAAGEGEREGVSLDPRVSLHESPADRTSSKPMGPPEAEARPAEAGGGVEAVGPSFDQPPGPPGGGWDAGRVNARSAQVS